MTEVEELRREIARLREELDDVQDELAEQVRQVTAIYAVVALSRFLVPVMIAAAGIVIGVMHR